MIEHKPKWKQGRRHSVPSLPIMEMQALAKKSQNTSETEQRLSSELRINYHQNQGTVSFLIIW